MANAEDAREYIDLPHMRDTFGIAAIDYVGFLLNEKAQKPLGWQSQQEYNDSLTDVMLCKIAPYSARQHYHACKSQIVRRNTAAAERAIRLAIVNNNA